MTTVVGTMLLMTANAQNREINFKHDTAFNEVLAEAKQQHKLIFFDAYTSWCGPCKMMANTVFKTDSVADFFNQNFVNLKVDMEKGEGPKLKDRFGVSAYPTLLFIDGDGNVIHKLVGSSPSPEFMAESRKALNPEKTVFGLAKKFDGGDHSAQTAMAYLSALEIAYEHVKMGEVAKIYFDALPKESLLEKANWELEKRFLLDVSSSSFAYLYSKEDELSAMDQKGNVERYFNQVFATTISSLKRAHLSNKNLKTAQDKAKAMETLLASNATPFAQKQLFTLHLTQLFGNKQWDKYCQLIDNNLNQAEKSNAQPILWAAMEMVREAPVNYCANANKWADAYSTNEDLFTQILVSDLRKMISKKQGNLKEAENFTLNSQNLRKQAGEKGQMTPPMMKD
ncbi:Thioredoxin [Solitalea koreensis]|uniref:Thioredoxin n=2 Tax=Solitalea koreensis TaxID=543615 RepID=A0A521CCA2_9SPHI|nr:Thioredoxin [Solitalea koreensis]